MSPLLMTAGDTLPTISHLHHAHPWTVLLFGLVVVTYTYTIRYIYLVWDVFPQAGCKCTKSHFYQVTNLVILSPWFPCFGETESPRENMMKWQKKIAERMVELEELIPCPECRLVYLQLTMGRALLEDGCALPFLQTSHVHWGVVTPPSAVDTPLYENG